MARWRTAGVAEDVRGGRELPVIVVGPDVEVAMDVAELYTSDQYHRTRKCHTLTWMPTDVLVPAPEKATETMTDMLPILIFSTSMLPADMLCSGETSATPRCEYE
jgi:hypothetical protein